MDDERHHDLPPALGLGKADRGERHRLLVLAAPGGQLVLTGSSASERQVRCHVRRWRKTPGNSGTVSPSISGFLVDE
jgi:hypothetical protein